MKLNIRKYQEGGGMPFTVYTPTPSVVSAPQETQQTVKQSEKSESNSY